MGLIWYIEQQISIQTSTLNWSEWWLVMKHLLKSDDSFYEAFNDVIFCYPHSLYS